MQKPITNKRKKTIGIFLSLCFCLFVGSAFAFSSDTLTTPTITHTTADSVLSRNANTGELGYHSVLAQYSNPYQETVYITVTDGEGNAQQIVSNKIHPFFTRVPLGQGLPTASEGHAYQGDITNANWVDASNLKAGYQLLSEDGKWQLITQVKQTQEALTAYNLTVETDHTYFIKGVDGSYGVWVHNDCFDKVNFNLNRLPTEKRAAVTDTLSHINSGEIPIDSRSRNWGTPFSNREGYLPKENGVTYTEYRVSSEAFGQSGGGTNRIVVGSDGRVYLTTNHYGQSSSATPFWRIQ